MNRFFAALVILAGCVAPVNIDEDIAVTQPANEEIESMGLVAVGPAPGGPFSTIDCPDDGNLATAEDVRRSTSALLRNDYLLFTRETTFTFAEEITGVAPIIGPPNTFTSSTFTDSKVIVDVPACEVDDDLEIVAWGNWQHNAASSANVFGRARVKIIEDYGGGSPSNVFPVGKAAVIYSGGAGTLDNYAITTRHRVVAAGDVRVSLQIAIEDVTGGAGTGTVILMFTARMDVKRIKRTL